METEQIHKDDLELKNLSQYYGSEHYYNLMGNLKATDGVNYIMSNGYAWLITDFNAVYLYNEKLKNEEFLSIKLKLNKDKAVMEVTDGNNNILYTQKYEWTNVKKEVNLFCCNDVLMLSNEY